MDSDEVILPVVGRKLPPNLAFHHEGVFAGCLGEKGEDSFAKVGRVHVDGAAVVVIDQVHGVGGVSWSPAMAPGPVFPQRNVKRGAGFRSDDFRGDFLRRFLRHRTVSLLQLP